MSEIEKLDCGLITLYVNGEKGFFDLTIQDDGIQIDTSVNDGFKNTHGAAKISRSQALAFARLIIEEYEADNV